MAKKRQTANDRMKAFDRRKLSPGARKFKASLPKAAANDPRMTASQRRDRKSVV